MDKITALKKALEALECGFSYSWLNTESCNCGVVLRASGLTASEIRGCDIGCYSETILHPNGPVCNVTGMPFSIVQERLAKMGFQRQDILDLEMLGSPEILSRMGRKIEFCADGQRTIEQGLYRYKDILIKYLRAWISILEDSKPLPIPEPEPVKPVTEPVKQGRQYTTVVIDRGIIELKPVLN